MNKRRMTTSQFAKLHHVNKRTLHYYDNIGLFSPCTKGENNYRYYEYMQSMEFAYIQMLKELHMGIEEIKTYVQHPSQTSFLTLAEDKIAMIDEEIAKLQRSKQILQEKAEQIKLCQTIQHKDIQIVQCPEEYYLTTPYSFIDNDMQKLMAHIHEAWDAEQYRMGIGSFIAVEKVLRHEYTCYDGLFTKSFTNEVEDVWIKPAGTYLCGYCKGNWDHLPSVYEHMIQYADAHAYQLCGYAYEFGLNDIAITDEEDYVTRIQIQIKE